MEKLKSFVENLRPHFQKDQIIVHLNNHQKKIIIVILTAIAILAVWGGYCFYEKSQSKKYSGLLHQALIFEQSRQLEKSNAILKEIYESSAPSGVRQIASLKYASQILSSGNNEKAIEIYLKINKTKSFDQYIREYAGLIGLRTMIGVEKNKEKISALISNLEKNSKILKYYIIEQKAIFAWENKEFKTAGEIFKILSQNPEVTGALKIRAEEMAKIYEEKFENKK